MARFDLMSRLIIFVNPVIGSLCTNTMLALKPRSCTIFRRLSNDGMLIKAPSYTNPALWASAFSLGLFLKAVDLPDAVDPIIKKMVLLPSASARSISLANTKLSICRLAMI